MPQFDLQLIQTIRSALEEIMTKVPLEYSTPATKAFLAEHILKEAAQGQIKYSELVAAGINQIQAVLSGGSSTIRASAWSRSPSSPAPMQNGASS